MTSKGTILYIGNFEMPDINAAAHRVLSIAKIFKKLDYRVVFLGVNKESASIDEANIIEGFEVYNRQYPKNIIEWIRHSIGITHVRSIINKYSDIKLIICYNAPSIATLRIRKFVKKRKIKVAGDYTEWYGGTKITSLKNLLSIIDSEFRMRFVAKKLDGLIVISEYLKDYYKNYNVAKVPPLIDLSDKKWKNNYDNDEKKIKIIFSGNSGQKDRLDCLIKELSKITNRNFIFYIAGQTKEQTIMMYGKAISVYIDQLGENIKFLGWLSHEENIKLILKSDLFIFIRYNTRQNIAGFPTKFVEATTCGIPTVTTKVGDVQYYINSGKNGILLDNDNYLTNLTEILKTSKKDLQAMREKIDKSLFIYENYISIIENWMKSM